MSIPPIMYVFSAKTGELDGQRPAQIVNGKPLTKSAYATTTPPPENIPDGHVARWTGNEWELVEDHRQHLDSKGTKQGGTPYWLPSEGDDWQSQPRYTEDLGPLPAGAVTVRPEKPFDVLWSEKMSEINALYQQAIATLIQTYPDDERLTFDKQEAEARAWLADNSTLTPFVDALAAGRQMDKAELVSRIIAKADAFALASGSLTGQRQRYEDMLDMAETADAVAAIVPQYSLPETE